MYPTDAPVKTTELERAVPGADAEDVSASTRPGPETEAANVAPLIVALDESLTSREAIALWVPIVLDPVIPVSELAEVEPAPYAVVPEATTILVVPPDVVAAAATVIETV